ncbi:hypothetical protein NDU88_006367 [Pleurodeles waltl]|uniref:Uncharacterized protein n=1 Tax=Pleurodeles waltl TaxID=8319 RepID=A0AAV7WFD7_PLEWA|nr:hypothetical protein NDU88_006367 [Pleurodeles waltl]
MEEAITLLDILVVQGKSSSSTLIYEQAMPTEGRRRRNKQRKGRAHKPSEDESRQERPALLCRLRSQGTAHQTYARLDLYPVSPRVFSMVTQVENRIAALLDHAWVVLFLQTCGPGPALKQWCLNVKLLEYGDIKVQIKRTMETYMEVNDTLETPVALLWDTLKAVSRGQFIAISACFNKSRRDQGKKLEDRVRELESSHRSTGSMALHRELTVTLKQLKAIHTDRAEYTLLRRKQRYHVGGNKAGHLLAYRLHAQTV